MQVCLEYLERYYVLIAFSAYLMEPGFDPHDPTRTPFGRWLAERPELYRYACADWSGSLVCLANEALHGEMRWGGLGKMCDDTSLGSHRVNMQDVTGRVSVMMLKQSVCSVLQRMLRRNPLAAMAMHRDGLPRHSLQEDHHKEQASLYGLCLPGHACSQTCSRTLAKEPLDLPNGGEISVHRFPTGFRNCISYFQTR